MVLILFSDEILTWYLVPAPSIAFEYRRCPPELQLEFETHREIHVIGRLRSDVWITEHRLDVFEL